MKLAIIGYGKMGKTIERLAKTRGHEPSLIIGSHNQSSFSEKQLKGIDVAIEFSTPQSAYSNLQICADAGVNTICGTTGWLDHREEIENKFKQHEAAFIYASNFSIGVNLFFHLNRKLAQLMDPHSQYKLSMDEIHHVHKLDAPSGTAISLAEDILSNNKQYNSWTNGAPKKADQLPIVSHREGEVYGTHMINYFSEIDMIQIKHEARSRDGFALGALIAAEFIQNKKGIYSMNDVLQLA